MITQRAEKAKSFFDPKRAAEYENRAKSRGLWEAENEVIADILDEVPEGSRVLDVPVGTGRFLPMYAKRDFIVTGLDASENMIALAREVSRGPSLRVGDIFKIDEQDRAFDLVMSIRIMHLIEHADFVLALKELMRVARNHIVLTLRVGSEIDTRWGPERLSIFLANLGEWSISRQTKVLGDWHLYELRRADLR